MRRWLPLIIVGLLVVAYLASQGGGSNDDTPTNDDEQLARAMCTDLRDDFSMYQMHASAVDYYRGTGRSEDAAQLAAAELEDLATSDFCPAFRDAFEATITYEKWIAP